MGVSICGRGWRAPSREELVVFLQLTMRALNASLKSCPSQAPRR